MLVAIVGLLPQASAEQAASQALSFQQGLIDAGGQHT